MNLIENVDISYFNNVSENISYNEFNIFYLNICSIRNKKDKLEDFLSQLKQKISIIVISETWLNSEESKFFEIEGYNSYHCTRNLGVGGGVSIFVLESILVNELVNYEADGNAVLVLALIKENVKVCGIYRKPDSNLKDFLAYYDDLLGKMKNMIVMSDFNLNLLNKTNISCSTYNSLVNANGYLTLNKISDEFMTRISARSNGSIIDHVTTDIFHLKYH